MWFIHSALALAALYSAFVLLVYLAQTWLLFPTTLAQAARPPLPPSARQIAIDTSGGETLAGVRIPAIRADEGAPALLGFGGNAWNAEAVALYLHGMFPERDVVAFHYRGYRPSTGSPSTRALMADSVEIFDALAGERPSQAIVAVGFSVGTGVAAHLARERPVGGLVMVTPFDSLERLARDLYWWAPVGLLLRHRMPTIDFVRDSYVPTAIVTAARDTIVPARRSEKLRAAVPNLVYDRVIDAGHNDLYERPDFTVAMREALATIEAAPLRPP